MQAGHLPQLFIAQVALLIAHAVIGGADLEYQITMPFQVHFGEAAFAGVQPAARLAGAPGQGPHRRRGQRAEAHRRNIVEAACHERLVGVGADHQRQGFGGVLFQGRIRRIQKDDAAGGVLLGGTERHGIAQVLGGAVDPAALGAVKRQLFPVHGKEILTEKLADMLEKVAKTTDQRVIPSNRVGLLEIAVLHPQDHGRHRHQKHHQQQAQGQPGGQ